MVMVVMVVLVKVGEEVDVRALEVVAGDGGDAGDWEDGSDKDGDAEVIR